MSVSYMPEKTKVLLWGKAAGRCEYAGCNEPLWLDSLTKAEFNAAYIAHIIADVPGGPRGHPTLSEELASSLDNLMLLCDKHHRLVDKEDVLGHPVERLRAMKLAHEQRIETLSAIQDDRQSHILLYGANIGDQSSPISVESAAAAMVPIWYPAERTPLTLSMQNSSFKDRTPEFWQIESLHLQNMVAQLVRPRYAQASMKHLSVFALAPQPLLILLGSLLTDLHAAEVYQLHREPPNWHWQEGPKDFDYQTVEPAAAIGPPALILSLSATITNERITTALGANVTIWRFQVNEPNNDFLRSRAQAQLFRQRMRLLLDRIKYVHGEDTLLHVFPAMPVALAVELGRVIMPKADLPMRIYDENKELGGFVPVLDINAHNLEGEENGLKRTEPRRSL